MPKRTNEFQQLMHFIYKQMTARGVRVTESALLEERGGGSEREVDILLEDEIAGETIRIAVECRDRNRPATIEWVDELIGKYQNLEVQKVVAVSRSGFSAPAAAKAAAHGIKTRTLEQSLETDWSEEFVRYGIAKISYRPALQEVLVETEPQLTGEADPSCAVADQAGNTYATLQEIVLDCFQRKVQVDACDYVNAHFLEQFTNLDDVKNKVLLFEERVLTPEELWLTDSEGTTRKLVSLTITVAISFATEISRTGRYLYSEKAHVTSGSVYFNGLGKAYSADIVQVAGEERGKIFFRPA